MAKVNQGLNKAALSRALARSNELYETDHLVKAAKGLRAELFDRQLDVIDDGCLRKAVLCPRRAGKTRCLVGYLLDVALSSPGARCVYITITRGMAKRLIWEDLKFLDTQHELRGFFHNTELYYRLSNGSEIVLGGADTQADVDKYRGQKFDLIVIDETKSFHPDLLDELIEQVLEPTLHDKQGTLVLAGTPGAILAGTFYNITGPDSTRIWEQQGTRRSRSRPWGHDQEWSGIAWEYSLHRWSTRDNKAAPQIWERVLANHIAKGQSDDDPVWRREYLGEWVSDTSGRVYYGYKQDVNGWTPDPSTPFGLSKEHEWNFVCGMDLGYDDDFSIQVAAYSKTCSSFFHVYGFNAPKLLINEMAAEYKRVERMFGRFEIVVGDHAGLGKAIFRSISELYGIVVDPIAKSDKRDHIELLNSDFLSKRAFVLKGSNLERQLLTVQWEDASTKRREDKAYPNHDTDAFLYLCRAAQHHFWTPEEKLPEQGTKDWEAWFDAQQVKQFEESESQQNQGGIHRKISVVSASQIYRSERLRKATN